MAPQVDRVTRIGHEGFSLIEDGWPSLPGRLPSPQFQQNHHHYHHQRQRQHHHQHQHQHQQVDRVTRIGHEGFSLIEDGWPSLTGRPGRLPLPQFQQNHHHYHHQHQHQQAFVYHGPQISTVRMPLITSNEVAQYYCAKEKEPVTASNEGAHYYGGIVKEPVINSDEAARYYDGFGIVEYGRKRQFL